MPCGRARAHNYLIEHSAGSGKSNTIAWLAHRLPSLHNVDNRPVFDKTVVITDRVVLDRQLQDTIYQFDHVAGVVKKIDEDSPQLADALAGSAARIIITTLQKLPFVLDKVATLSARRYAVIIDEAHSSQTGESANALKRALGRLGSDDIDEDGDPLTASALARGRHPNLSYFAFTATPKSKTPQLFGTRNPSSGNDEPFHVYSMRQAIEENLWYHAGVSHAESGGVEPAVGYLTRFLAGADAADPLYRDALFQLGTMLPVIGRVEDGLRHLRRLRPILVAEYGPESTHVTSLDRRVSQIRRQFPNSGEPAATG